MRERHRKEIIFLCSVYSGVKELVSQNQLVWSEVIIVRDDDSKFQRADDPTAAG